MAVTGYYYVSPTVTRGFVREADGTITTFEVLGAWTEPESINDGGDITGYYVSPSGEGFVAQSFVRNADGRITTFNPPCAYDDCGSQPYIIDPPSIAYSINAFGEVVGSYPFVSGNPAGFSRSQNGSFRTYDQELAALPSGRLLGVVATAINASGTVTGIYGALESTVTQSFIEDARGYLTAGIVVPAPGTDKPYTELETTVAEGINAEGAVVGWYAGCNTPCGYPPAFQLTVGGFLRSPQGQLTLFNPPGALVTSPSPGLTYQIEYPIFPTGWRSSVQTGSFASAPHRLSINQPGSITGSYSDPAGVQHGFVRNPYGTITSFDPPRGKQTTATSINDSGVIAGSYYYDWNAQIAEGFLRLPPKP